MNATTTTTKLMAFPAIALTLPRERAELLRVVLVGKAEGKLSFRNDREEFY